MNQEISQRVKDIIKKIKFDKKKKTVIGFFANDVKSYGQKISILEDKIKNNDISHKTACTRFSLYSDNLFKKIGKIERMVNEKVILKHIKNTFRSELKSLIDSSLLMSRGFYKPSGHPGDFKTIEMFYDKDIVSEGIGFCGDKYILQDNYVKAVRIRKNMMKKELVSFIRESKPNSLSIMNLGCGSSREMREIFPKLSCNKELNFTLVDWDKEALKFAKKSLNLHKVGKNTIFKFRRENIFNFYRYPQRYIKALKRQDLIYSIGLADYMPNLIFGETIKFCFNLLKENGTLMIAHKNVKVHKSYASDWFCDWNFYSRSIKDVKEVVYENLKGYEFSLRIVKEKTNHIFFVVVTKL